MPNKLYAKVAPITVNTPRPIASNFKKIFQCFFILEYSKNKTMPEITVMITYDGSIREFGNVFPIMTSGIFPPATPVIVA